MRRREEQIIKKLLLFDFNLLFRKFGSDLFNVLLERSYMPTISMFYGIIIRMYFSPGEHNPPHFHAYYQGKKAVVDINSCEIISSDMSPRQNKIIVAWAELRKDELLADWELAMKGESLFSIEPLK